MSTISGELDPEKKLEEDEAIEYISTSLAKIVNTTPNNQFRLAALSAADATNLSEFTTNIQEKVRERFREMHENSKKSTKSPFSSQSQLSQSMSQTQSTASQSMSSQWMSSQSASQSSHYMASQSIFDDSDDEVAQMGPKDEGKPSNSTTMWYHSSTQNVSSEIFGGTQSFPSTQNPDWNSQSLLETQSNTFQEPIFEGMSSQMSTNCSSEVEIEIWPTSSSFFQEVAYEEMSSMRPSTSREPSTQPMIWFDNRTTISQTEERAAPEMMEPKSSEKDEDWITLKTSKMEHQSRSQSAKRQQPKVQHHTTFSQPALLSQTKRCEMMESESAEEEESSPTYLTMPKMERKQIHQLTKHQQMVQQATTFHQQHLPTDEIMESESAEEEENSPTCLEMPKMERLRAQHHTTFSQPALLSQTKGCAGETMGSDSAEEEETLQTCLKMPKMERLRVQHHKKFSQADLVSQTKRCETMGLESVEEEENSLTCQNMTKMERLQPIQHHKKLSQADLLSQTKRCEMIEAESAEEEENSPTCLNTPKMERLHQGVLYEFVKPATMQKADGRQIMGRERVVEEQNLGISTLKMPKMERLRVQHHTTFSQPALLSQTKRCEMMELESVEEEENSPTCLEMPKMERKQIHQLTKHQQMVQQATTFHQQPLPTDEIMESESAEEEENSPTCLEMPKMERKQIHQLTKHQQVVQQATTFHQQSLPTDEIMETESSEEEEEDPSFSLQRTKLRQQPARQLIKRPIRKGKASEEWDDLNNEILTFLRELKAGKVTRNRLIQKLTSAFGQLRSYCTLRRKSWECFPAVQQFVVHVSRLYEFAFKLRVEETCTLLPFFLEQTMIKFLKYPSRISVTNTIWNQIREVLSTIFHSSNNADLLMLMLETMQHLQNGFLRMHGLPLLGGVEETVEKRIQRSIISRVLKELNRFREEILNRLTSFDPVTRFY